MSGVVNAVLSAWTWLVIGTCILLWLPLMGLVRLVTLPFDPDAYWTGYLFRKIGNVAFALTPIWRARVSGRMPANPRNPYVVVSNHESFVDILLISHLPFEMKWLSKVELFRLPVLGWLMRLARDIPVQRGEARSAVEAMQRCRAKLGRKLSVMIFPEGTRSSTDDMLPFKDGAFRLAVETGVPILPLAVKGSRTALKKKSWRIGRSDAEVRVLAPVSVEGLTRADVPQLRDRVQELIRLERDRMRAGQ
ncbi:MAG: 1-acyl-sn-glycerol-3-phosphate acyltransferase [Gemmatimonadales bacterium]|nr:1-acyl-sn-glycerol-3-phosphate acyltransferase [Gemmatimonadales bacterium]